MRRQSSQHLSVLLGKHDQNTMDRADLSSLPLTGRLACLSCRAQIESDLKATLFAACNSCYRCWLWPRVSSPNALAGLSVELNPTWNVSIIMDLLLLHQRAVRTAQLAVPKMSSNHERCKWSSIKCNFLCGFSHLEQIPSMIIQEECL